MRELLEIFVGLPFLFSETFCLLLMLGRATVRSYDGRSTLALGFLVDLPAIRFVLLVVFAELLVALLLARLFLLLALPFFVGGSGVPIAASAFEVVDKGVFKLTALKISDERILEVRASLRCQVSKDAQQRVSEMEIRTASSTGLLL